VGSLLLICERRRERGEACHRSGDEKGEVGVDMITIDVRVVMGEVGAVHNQEKNMRRKRNRNGNG
jgi:hypothetical protein